jgi:hypothetical protein
MVDRYIWAQFIGQPEHVLLLHELAVFPLVYLVLADEPILLETVFTTSELRVFVWT